MQVEGRSLKAETGSSCAASQRPRPVSGNLGRSPRRWTGLSSHTTCGPCARLIEAPGAASPGSRGAEPAGITPGIGCSPTCVAANGERQSGGAEPQILFSGTGVQSPAAPDTVAAVGLNHQSKREVRGECLSRVLSTG